MKNEELEARALVMSFHLIVKDFELAKQCALIAVDKIISNCPFKDFGFKFDSVPSRLDAISDYWKQVQIEIKKL